MAASIQFIENLIAKAYYFNNYQWRPVLQSLGILQPAVLASGVRAQLAALVNPDIVPGEYETFADLEAAFPAAANPGRWAWMVTRAPFAGLTYIRRIALANPGMIPPQWFVPGITPGLTESFENVAAWPGSVVIATAPPDATQSMDSAQGDGMVYRFIGVVGEEGTLNQPGMWPLLSLPVAAPGVLIEPVTPPADAGEFITCFDGTNPAWTVTPPLPWVAAVAGTGTVTNTPNTSMVIDAPGGGDTASLVEAGNLLDVVGGIFSSWKAEIVDVTVAAEIAGRFTDGVGAVEHEAVLQFDPVLGDTILIVDGQAPVATGDYINLASYLIIAGFTDVSVLRWDPIGSQWSEILTDALDPLGVVATGIKTSASVAGPGATLRLQRLAYNTVES